MVDFTSILSKKVTETEKPKPRPIGTYRGVLQGMPTQKEVTVQGEARGIISFKVKAQMALEDVDHEALQAHGEVSTWPPFNLDFWVDTPEGEYAMQQFLENTLKLDLEEKSYGEALAESAGMPLNFNLAHRPATDKSGAPVIYTEIKGTAAV